MCPVTSDASPLTLLQELTSPRLIKSHLPYRFLPSDLHNGDSKVIPCYPLYSPLPPPQPQPPARFLMSADTGLSPSWGPRGLTWSRTPGTGRVPLVEPVSLALYLCF